MELKLKSGVLLSALYHVVDAANDYKANVQQADQEWLTGEGRWNGAPSKGRFLRAFKELMQAGLDHAGVDVFPLPAEYVAAAVSVYVHPANQLLACGWLGQQFPLAAEARGVESGSGSAGIALNPRQVFALVLECNQDRQAFQDILTEKINNAGVGVE